MGAVHRYSGRRRFARKRGYGWSNPLSQFKNVKFIYADTGFNLSTGGSLGVQGWHTFRGNGAYDPDEGVGGVQPYGWDTLLNASNYTFYKVIASKISVTFYPTEACKNMVLTVVPAIIGTLTYANSDDLRALPHARQVHWSDVQRPLTITSYMTTARMFGFPYGGDIDASAGASYSTNPALQWRWHVFTDTNSIASDVDCYLS